MPHASDLWCCMSAHLEDLADFLSPMEETEEEVVDAFGVLRTNRCWDLINRRIRD